MALNAPEQLDVFLERLAAIDGEVVLLGVRHHSPACARYVRTALERVRPAAVVIEGPPDYNDRIELLQQPELTPPIALFNFVAYPALADGSVDALGGMARYRGWYPFCDYSPEFVALQTAARLGAPASFCDLSLHERLAVGADPEVTQRLREGDQDLFEASFLAKEAFFEGLQRQLGARDTDEVWDRLFEARATDGVEAFARDIAAFGSTIRGLASPDVIAASNDPVREARMAHGVREALEAHGGPVVLVCGAFHLLGVREALDDEAPPPDIEPLPSGARAGIHLVPYDFRRMARLHYASGMPSPEWYQAMWEAEGRDDAWLALLTEAGREARSGRLPVSTADLEAAAEMAERLARFRGYAVPTRMDVLDAVRSCWVKGSTQAGWGSVLTTVERVFRGDRRGRVPTGGQAPPLVRDVDAKLAELSLEAEDGPREVRLRPIRDERHRERMRGLLRLQYLGVDYGELLRGPRPLEGVDLDRVEQVWRIGWDTESRSRLFECVHFGASLREAVAERLRDRIADAPERAENGVTHLKEACALGLHGMLPALLSDVSRRIDEDGRLLSVLTALHELVLLYRYRDVFDAIDSPAVEALINRCWQRGLWMLDALAGLAQKDEDRAVAGLQTLHHTALSLSDDAQLDLDPDELYDAVAARRRQLRDAPGVHGAVDGILWRAGRLPTHALAADAHARFQEAEYDAPGRFLAGLMAVARRAYVDDDALIADITEALLALDEQEFRGALPGLRRAHTALTPRETTRLARTIARLLGGDPLALGAQLSAPPATLASLHELAGELRADLSLWGVDLNTAGNEPQRAQREAKNTKGDSGEEKDLNNSASSAVKYPPEQATEARRRWRLVLGRFAEDALGGCCAEADGQIDEVLSFLYDREYTDSGRDQRGADLSASQLTVPEWLDGLEELFPKETYEKVEAEALDRYGLNELVTDPRVLSRCEASLPMLEAILRLKSRMSPGVLAAARRLVAEVVEELRDKFEAEVEVALSGRTKRGRAVPRGSASSFDARETIRRNLRHYDPERGQLIIERPWFRQRVRRRSDWRVVVCVDQSGSMLTSTVHASILASIFSSMPDLQSHLVAFDTSVVDLTQVCDDPVETLMSVQLGGGTNIAQAVGYCDGLVERPDKTLFVLITDLYEGGDARALVQRIDEMCDSGVRVLILGALDANAEPEFDRQLARRLTQVGANCGAMTPKQLVRWIDEVMG